MDQDILPVVLALLALHTVHPSMTHIVPGMNFKERRGTKNAGDFDFLYVVSKSCMAKNAKMVSF